LLINERKLLDLEVAPDVGPLAGGEQGQHGRDEELHRFRLAHCLLLPWEVG